jgi:hypothetical protein
MVFFDNANTQLTPVVGNTSTVTANTWARYTMTATVPATAVRVRMDYSFSAGVNWAVNDTIDATGAMLLIDAPNDSYFDGSTAPVGVQTDPGALAYSWTGTTDASASIESIAAATTTITATPEPSTGPQDPPRVRIDISIDDPTVAQVTVTRLDPDGRTSIVRTQTGGPLPLSVSGTDRVGLIYDYEVPLGQPVTYSTAELPGTVSSQITLTGSAVWLIHPGVPERSMSIDLRAESFAAEQWAVSQGVLWPMGRDKPVVQTEGIRRAASSSLTVATSTLAELARLRSLLADAGVLYLNIPPTYGYGIDPCYVAIGDVGNRRISDIGADPIRAVDLPYFVVDRPEGGTQSERTYLDVLGVYPSYLQVRVSYPTYAALLAGP